MSNFIIRVSRPDTLEARLNEIEQLGEVVSVEYVSGRLVVVARITDPSSLSFILLENDSYLILEDGSSKFILE